MYIYILQVLLAVSVTSLTPRVDDGTFSVSSKIAVPKLVFGLLNCQKDTEHEPLLHVSTKFLSFTSFLPFQYPIVRTGG